MIKIRTDIRLIEINKKKGGRKKKMRENIRKFKWLRKLDDI